MADEKEDMGDLCAELVKKYGRQFVDVEKLTNAWYVVDDYCTNGGENISDGTGF